jgi:tyrosine-protein kinase Etk/Wzc
MASSLDLAFLRDRAALKRIAAVTLACATLGVVYALVAPRWYRSVLTVMPAKQQRGGGIASMLGGDLGGLAAGLDPSLGGSADPTRIAAVLQSVALTDAVIEKFDLRARYRETYQEDTREALWRHCEVKTLLKANLVQLTCEDKDPRFVQELLAYFAESGNQLFRRVGVSSASEEVRFLDKRVAELRHQAEDTAARMRAFQEQHQIVDLDTQAKAVVSALATLNTQRIAKQLELGYARTFSSRDEGTTQQLESQLGLLDAKLRDLGGTVPATEAAAGDTRRDPKASSGMFPDALSVPKLRAEFEGLYRDRKVAEATLVFALERLESAKATEARDVSTFLVLDPPTLPTRHSRPKRAQVVALLGLIGLVGSVLLERGRASGAAASFSAVFPFRARRAADPSDRGGDSRTA